MREQPGLPAPDPVAVISWVAPPPPAVTSEHLGGSAPEVVSLRTAAPAPPRVESRPSAVTPPRTVSIAIGRAGVRVRSFGFAGAASGTAPEWLEGAAEAEGVGAAPPRAERPLSGRRTRIAPPRDLVKLEDRLHYLLQPPLESLFAERALSFPYEPFPYQFEGIAFLYPRHAAVLADEMGLGKTMQAVTAIRLLMRRGEVRRVLLVCPKPLVTNWQREFALWAPEIPAMAVEGDRVRRQWQWALDDVPVRIANYEILHRDEELLLAGAGGAAPPPFDLVVLDEAQRIKNRASATARAACALARSRGWALTGTPVENSPEDLVGIFEFLSPGLLSPQMKPRKMGRTVSDYVLRRTKDTVLTDLPPKLFREAQLELTPEQRATYQLAEEEGVLRLAEMEQAATIQHVFELVLRLKQICNFDPATGASAKLERLQADLEEVVQSGRKAIVFSQYVRTLETLAANLGSFHPLMYHGKVRSAERDRVIGRFRGDPRCQVLLMSYGAGSVGLNLQFASYVFLFDRWWNPAVEDQAINRAHRIGAAGPVTVSRFVTLATIEERIDRVLEEKRELFATIFSDSRPQQRTGLSQEEIFGLFDLACPARAA